MRIRLLFSVFAVSLILLAGGCSKPLTKSGMTPSHIRSYQSTGSIITVLPVVIRPQPKPWYANQVQMPDANLYRESIVDTLQHTALFSEVKIAGDSDYSLSTVVIAERLLGGMNNIGLFLIRYELTDLSTGRTIWSENVFSHSMLSAAEVFAGWERVPKVVETGVRSNMRQLATKIGNVMSVQAQ